MAQRHFVRKAAAEQLALVSNLKVSQIQAWMDHEKSTARGLVSGMLASRQMEAWLRDGVLETADRERFLTHLKAVQAIFGCKDVSLLSIGGQPLMSSSGLQEGVGHYDRWVLADALLERAPKLTTIRWDDEEARNALHLDVLVPLAGSDSGHPLAVLRLRVDPARDLFPLAQEWPKASRTAETLLIESQGADVVYLNELLHQKDTALRLRIPMNDPDLLSAQVARGAVGVFLEGRDSLGHRVLGMGQAIPGTQWHLVAKEDRDELYRGLWSRTVLTALAALGFVTVTLLLIRSWILRRVSAHVQGELEAMVKARTDQLEAALLRAQAGDRAKSTFLAHIGHELLTPLNHMQLYALLLREEHPEGNQATDLDRILASGRTLEAMIRQLMRYASLEAGGEQVVHRSFRPLPLARELADHFAREAESKGIAFAFEPAADAPQAWSGDPDRTGDILRELLGNALKFTADGRVTFRMGGGPRLCFEVEDTGPGIPEGARERVFRPLEQGDDSLTRGHGGAGIGLAIAQRLAEILDGELSWENIPEGGSRFRLCFRRPGLEGSPADS
jgi:signal transduction histidine kinase